EMFRTIEGKGSSVLVRQVQLMHYSIYVGANGLLLITVHSPHEKERYDLLHAPEFLPLVNHQDNLLLEEGKFPHAAHRLYFLSLLPLTVSLLFLHLFHNPF